MHKNGRIVGAKGKLLVTAQVVLEEASDDLSYPDADAAEEQQDVAVWFSHVCSPLDCPGLCTCLFQAHEQLVSKERMGREVIKRRHNHVASLCSLQLSCQVVERAVVLRLVFGEDFDEAEACCLGQLLDAAFQLLDLFVVTVSDVQVAIGQFHGWFLGTPAYPAGGIVPAGEAWTGNGFGVVSG